MLLSTEFGSSWVDINFLYRSYNTKPQHLEKECLLSRLERNKNTYNYEFDFLSLSIENRTNQCNPNHQPTGPGHQAGYQGAGTKPDLNNHANQLNPNNGLYQPPKKWKEHSQTPTTDWIRPSFHRIHSNWEISSNTSYYSYFTSKTQLVCNIANHFENMSKSWFKRDFTMIKMSDVRKSWTKISNPYKIKSKWGNST